VIRIIGYGLIAEKSRVGKLGHFFRAPCNRNYTFDQKMNYTFYDGHDELYHHAKFGEDRTMRTGCRCENVVFFYRQDAAKGQIKFTNRPKIRFFAARGRLVVPMYVMLGRADGYVGPLGCAKFHLNRHKGVGMRPQNIKIFHFLGSTP